MADKPDSDDDLIPGHGVVVRAANGDVIRYDPSGLVMRLSDKVIDDIALRLGAAMPASRAPAGAPDAPVAEIDADDLLDTIDAWDVRQKGQWLHFTARLAGAQGVRGFRRHLDGGTVLGDGPGPVLGILGLGGPRAALASAGAPAFPHHVVAPQDDIGAVGHAGVDKAVETDRLEGLRERTHEALVADTILGWQMEKFAPLPLIFARVETDGSASAGALAAGRAVENLLVAAGNLKSAAARMGKRAKLLAVCLDFALEDLSGDATAYRDGMLATMQRIGDGLWSLGYDKPLFVARFEAGLTGPGAEAVLAGQWELAWNHGDHRLIHSAPSYMFTLDRYDRPTEEARIQMAEMTAAALSAGADWRCPTLFLAEREPGDGRSLRVTLQAEGDLVLEPAGTTHGFALLNAGSATIETITIAPDDPQALLIRCSARPEGTDLRLAYAAGGPGGVRDGWSLASATGATLHRWALPAILPVTDGAHD